MNFKFKSFSFKYLVFACLLVLVLVVSLNVVSAIDSVPNQTIPDVISDDAVSFDYVNQNLLINEGSNFNSDVNLNEVSLLSTNDGGVNSNSNDSQLNNQTDSLQQDFSSQSIIVNEEKSVCDESEAGSDSSGLSVNSSSIFNLNSSVDNSSFVGSSSLSGSSNSSFVGSSSLSGSSNSSVFNDTIYNTTFDDGHFTISGVNGSVSGHAFVVSCEDDLNIVSKYLYDFNNKDEYIWVNFVENVNLNIIPYNSTLLFNSGHVLIINGNGATVNIKKSKKFKSLFLLNDYQNSVYISNLTVNGFDRGVVNYGGLDLNCVCFSDSSISGVINYAQLSCENSSFKSNVGSSGAIYADTSSINKLIVILLIIV